MEDGIWNVFIGKFALSGGYFTNQLDVSKDWACFSHLLCRFWTIHRWNETRVHKRFFKKGSRMWRDWAKQEHCQQSIATPPPMPHVPSPLIAGHFTEAGKVNNRSLRKYYTCNHCTDNPALVPQHRDNVLLEHLTDPNKCPNVLPMGLMNRSFKIVALKLWTHWWRPRSGTQDHQRNAKVALFTVCSMFWFNWYLWFAWRIGKPDPKSVCLWPAHISTIIPRISGLSISSL